MSEEASEETGAEDDNPDESKQNDRVTAKDLKLSLSIGNEEHEALQKLRYKIFLVPRSSKESETIMSFVWSVNLSLGQGKYSWHFNGNRFRSCS